MMTPDFGREAAEIPSDESKKLARSEAARKAARTRRANIEAECDRWLNDNYLVKSYDGENPICDLSDPIEQLVAGIVSE